MEEKDPNAKEGGRIRLVSMVDDPNPVAPGTEGTIRLVDGMGVIHVNWDDGRTIGVIPGIDRYQLLDVGVDYGKEVNEKSTDMFDSLYEADSGASAIKSTINKTPSVVNKSMPKPTKLSSSTNSALKSSGIKTGQVNKNFKSAGIKDVKVESKTEVNEGLFGTELSLLEVMTAWMVYNNYKEYGFMGTLKLMGNNLKELMEDFIEFSTTIYGTPVSKDITEYQFKMLLKKFKAKNKEDDTDYMSAGGGGTTTSSVGGVNGMGYDSPAAWGTGVLTKKTGIAKPGPVKEATATFNNTSSTTIKYKKYDDNHTGKDSWADTNSDGWRFNDDAFYEEGVIVDPLAKINATWDDEKLDVSKEWDKYQDTKIGVSKKSKKSLKKEDLLRMVQTRLSEAKKGIKVDLEKGDEILTGKFKNRKDTVKKIGKNKEKQPTVNDKPMLKFKIPKLDTKKEVKEEELDETTTFASVWGSNGPPVGPAFAAKKGDWKMIKRPIWKGGTIVQTDLNSGIMNPINEVNKVKYNPKGKYVTVKKKCTKFPYCNQGDINALNINDKVGSGTYVEETMKNIHEIAKQTGKSFDEVYNIVKESTVKEGKVKDFFLGKNRDIFEEIYNRIKNNLPEYKQETERGWGSRFCYIFEIEGINVKSCYYSGFRDGGYELYVNNQEIKEAPLGGLTRKIHNLFEKDEEKKLKNKKTEEMDNVRAKLKYGYGASEDAFNQLDKD